MTSKEIAVMGTGEGLRRNTPNQVITPAVQGSNHTRYQLVWQQATGDLFDLRGATISGTRKDTSRNDVYDLTGEFEITHAEKGEFTWRPSATDTSIAGNLHVQFVASFDDGTTEITYPAQWVVQPRDAVTAVGAPPLVGVREDVAICVTSICDGVATAEEGAVLRPDGLGGVAWLGGIFKPYDYTPTLGVPAFTGGTAVVSPYYQEWDVTLSLGDGFYGFGLVGGFVTNNSPSTATVTFYDYDFPDLDPNVPSGTGIYATVADVPTGGASVARHFSQIIVPIFNSKIYIHARTSPPTSVNIGWNMKLFAVMRTKPVPPSV